MAQSISQTETMSTNTPAKSSLPLWQIWGVFLVLLSSGIGFTATSWLFKLPGLPDCAGVFWPLASASARLYCAQLSAEEQTVNGLLEAIALVKDLPNNHPMRADIDRNLGKWAIEILNLAEEKFQAGQLQDAILIVRKIPQNIGVDSQVLVSERIAKWQSTWTKAQNLYSQVEKQSQLSNWNNAFRQAVKLSYLDNEYWATKKFEQAVNLIQVAKDENAKLDFADLKLRQGGMENILAAITKATEINSESHIYQKAQKLIGEAEEKLVKIANNLVYNRSWQTLLDLARGVSLELTIQAQASDWRQLASAGLAADSGTIYGLETAIIQAQDIPEDSEIYTTAQSLINRWQLEIEGLTYLTKARELSYTETISGLTAAITEADLVARNNPLYRQAQKEIQGWRRKIQIIEDRPYLERAKQLGESRDIATLQKAIAQANLITSNRPLYQEAQNNISKWRATIQKMQDQPILDDAIYLANMNNFYGAIATAQQIRGGRALYQEAQEKIKIWQKEIQAKRLLAEANQVAKAQNVEALAKAMRIAQQIPSSTLMQTDKIVALNRWGEKLLGLAQEQSKYSLKQAIVIAEKIPIRTSAYNKARDEIQRWQNLLKPSELIQQSSNSVNQESFPPLINSGN